MIEEGIAKKAPMHVKSSVADAIIIFSIFDYAEKNQGHEYFFVTKNKSDFHKNGVIHPDLKPTCDTLTVRVFKKLKTQIDYIKQTYRLSTSDQIELRRKERIRNKIKERAYNPEYEKLLADQGSSFILNLNMIELILREEKPTKEQVIFVLALIDLDADYEQKFYKRLKTSNWFKILKSKGVFKPENNSLSFWHPLTYLEELSRQIKAGTALELVDELIAVVRSVSANSKDTSHTWYSFIKILTNLPNDKVPLDIFNFIPIWLDGNIETQKLCTPLLSKFLS